MAGGEALRIRPRKGEYIIFDTSMPARVDTVIFGAPTAKGKGVLFAPTVYGNMLAGPTAQETGSKTDKSTSRAGLDAVFASAKKLRADYRKEVRDHRICGAACGIGYA